MLRHEKSDMEKGKILKRSLFWIAGILLTPILLFILITILLYIPPIQNYVVDKVAAYASQKSGKQISIDRVSLVFPLDLGVNGVKVIQPNDSLPQVRDTVADIRSITLDVQFMPLLKKNIEINAFEITKAKINTTDFIPDVRVKGNVEHLYAVSHNISLSRENAHINRALLDSARLVVELNDTAKKDTSKSANYWKIAVQQLLVKRADITVHTPGDTMTVQAYLGKAELKDGNFDLGSGLYTVRSLDWGNGLVKYDNNMAPKVKGLDANHILLSGIRIGFDSMSYHAHDIALSLRHCAFREKSGIRVDELSGKVVMDSLKVNLPILHLRTPDSWADASMVMDFNVMDAVNPGKIRLSLNASLGKQDLMMWMGGMPQLFIRRYPNAPLTIRGSVVGNMKHIVIGGLDMNLPTALHAKAFGTVSNLDDMKRLYADIHLRGNTYNLGFITCLLPADVMSQYRIPYGIGLDGHFVANGPRYTADFTAREGNGTVKANAYVDTRVMAYRANLKVNNLQIHHFMPHDSIYAFSGNVKLDGHGTDYLHRSFWLNADASISQLHYGHWNLDNVKAKTVVRNGIAHADIDSHNALLDGLISFDALLSTKKIQATVSADVRKADLYRMRFTAKPLIAALCGHVDINSDLKTRHSLVGNVSDMTVITSEKAYRPVDISMNIVTNPDTTYAQILSGNMEMDMHSPDGYEKIMAKAQHCMNVLMKQIKDKVIDQAQLKRALPELSVYIMSGNENPFAEIMKYYGITFSDMLLTLNTSPSQGINGNGHIYSLNADSVQLDTLNLTIYEDSAQTKFKGQVKNNKNNPQFVFNALFDGYLLKSGAGLDVKYYDANNKLGAKLGVAAEMVDSGIRMHLYPDKPVLGYKTFNLNHDNYLMLGNDRRISANIDLIADDGTGVKIYSTPNEEALQDMTVSLYKFDLEKITDVIPYAPRMTGMLDGDFHAIQTKKEISVTSDMSVRNMTYEHSPIGNISTEFVYLPKEDGTHTVDGRLFWEDKEVMTIDGTYRSQGEGYLKAKLGMAKFPLQIVNGFVPEHLMGLNGYGEGEINIEGSLSKPNVNGEVYLDSAHLISEPYSVDLRFDDDPVRIVGSNLLLENFEMYAHNNNPLNIYGYVNFADLDKINMDVKMRAVDYQLIDAKKTRRSELYGKMYVDFFGRINGLLDNLQMRGKLGVKGNSDITYILKDSPLTTDNQLDGLATFVDMSDTTMKKTEKPPLTGLNMDMQISVENGATVNCDLNADHSNYVNLEGGGDLRMKYNTADGIRLTGRYTVNSGEMKYSLPVIPLKTFSMQSGSYVEFTGDVMNPKLNIVATERTKALVGAESENSRSVAFDVGVKVTQTLQKMGLEFTLDAPEDMTVKNELAAMSVEQRGKLAVTMLTTGMYLADGNTSAFSMNSALNSFLQNEITNITGNALKTMDLSFGMDNSTGSDGRLHTDYSFKFAKRFWDNRLSISVGGKVSSSAEENRQNNSSFLDNVTMEYRLDNTAMRYVKLYYDRGSYDLLEGQVTEYGAGMVLRKKADNILDLFKFGKSAEQLPPADNALKPDSTIKPKTKNAK